MPDKKQLILFGGLLLFIFVLLFEVFEDPAVNTGFAILLIAAVLWISEAVPLPVTALLIPLLASITGVLSVTESFINFANPIIFLFLGGFVLATALSKYQLDRWVAYKMMLLSTGSFIGTSIAMMSATAFISMWVSNTSTVAMMLPLGMGLIALAKKDKFSPESTFLLLGIAYAANIGGVTTLIGSPPNAIGAGIMNISFAEWLKFGIPVFVITFPLMILVLYLYFKPDRNLHIPLDLEFHLPQTKKLWMLMVVFGLTVILWLFEQPIGTFFDIPSHFNAVVAVFAVVLIGSLRILDWNEIEKGVQWGVLILFGGGITLGAVLEKSGFGAFLSSHLIILTENLPMILFILIIVTAAIFFTELMSNTASAALFIPLLYALAEALDQNPLLFVIPATIAASYSFMLPVGTPPNAIVFGSGLIKQKSMISVGFILNILFAFILTIIIYFLT